MCRIAGWMRRGEDKLSKDELVSLLLNMQVGGIDATGVGFFRDGKIITIKAPGPAKNFVKDRTFLDHIPSILNSPWVLLHTRNATHGSPSDNENNHPIMNSKGMIIHNGVVYSKEELESIGETDSEQLMLHIQKYGWEGIRNFTGTMAIAYVELGKPGFYLYRHASQLVWAYSPDRNILFFCSTSGILLNSIRYSMVLNEFPNILVSNVPKDTIFHITNKIEEVIKVEAKSWVLDKDREIAYFLPNYSGFSV